jgi:hypothetical protein
VGLSPFQHAIDFGEKRRRNLNFALCHGDHFHDFATDFTKIAMWAASGVVCLIRREAIEESRTTGALEPVLATVARGV